MKLFYSVVILFFLNSCSFDKNSGIWKNDNSLTNNENEKIFKDFKNVSSSTETFEKIIPINKKFNFKINDPYKNQSWTDIFYGKNNNLKNFKYDNFNKVTLKSKKLSRYKSDDYILFNKNNLIFSDERGNLFVYSVKQNSILSKFNFYQKKYKHIKKKLRISTEKNIIYVSDNIGYIYAYNYEKNKIIWAKNYKIPFRSNIKLQPDKILISNQNNDLVILEKNTGNLIKLIPSEETTINNLFMNNIASGKENIFFLNTYGSLYSFNKNNFNLNWFINFNKSLNLSLSNIFTGTEIVQYKNNLLVASNESFYILDSQNGSIISKNNFSLLQRPIIINNYIFLITKNNFLISLNSQNGQIIYSYDIAQKVADFINTKKKKLEVKNIMLVNNNLFIFLKNSNVLKFDLRGEIIEIIKLPSSLHSQPIIANSSLLYLNNKNRLFILN